MRAVSLVLVSGLLWLGATSAEALSISPNPITEVRGDAAPGGSLSASLSAVSVSGNQAVFQLAVSAGEITAIDLSMLFDNISAPTAFDFVTGAAFAGSGTGGTASVAAGGTQAQFDFASAIGVGGSAMQLVVTFAGPVQLSWQGSAGFDNGYLTTQTYTVVPEPAALVLLGLGLGGVALARRRGAT